MISKEIRASYHIGMASADEYTKIRYDLVDTIIYAMVDIKSDGNILKSGLYNPVPLVQYAHDRGVKVVLMFSTTYADNDIILGNATIRIAAINSLLNETIAQNFDGVCNNIENINRINTITGTPNRDLMTVFHKELSEKFWAKKPNYDLSAWIGYANWNDIWDVVGLKNYVNYFQIMAYGFGRGSTDVSQAGSYTPIDDVSVPSWIPQGIRGSITYWKNQGLDMNKTILGITYEGYEWPTVDDSRLSNTTGVGTIKKYDEIVIDFPLYRRVWDNEWKTPYFIRQVDSQWYQLHIDDPQSLGIKYDLVNSEQLAGIAIWTIDEGTDRTELWQVIQDKLSLTMGNWIMAIEGMGQYDNNNSQKDADKLIEKFIVDLKMAGHSVVHASITTGQTISTFVTIISPDGGEKWRHGTARTISWSYTGNPAAYLKIELLKAGVLNSVIIEKTPIGTSGLGSYNWVIPALQTLGNDYKIRITSTTNSLFTDSSNSNFIIN